jgi:hypothetical protein
MTIETARIVDGGRIGQRRHRPDAWHRHQSPACGARLRSKLDGVGQARSLLA